MSTLKTNHCDWDKNTRREMTLNEFVRQLPISHCARKEFKALQAKIARLKSEKTLLAMLAADTPQFDSSVLCTRAKELRDKALAKVKETL